MGASTSAKPGGSGGSRLRSIAAAGACLSVAIVPFHAAALGHDRGSATVARSHQAADVPVALLQSTPAQGQDFKQLSGVSWANTAPGNTPGPVIDVDDSKRYQYLWGVGAAVTNSAAFVLSSDLDSEAREQTLRYIFGPPPHNAHLSFVRISIGGSDFNQGGERYSEDDLPPGRTDPKLTHFNLLHDRYMISILQQAMAINPNIRIIATPWTAPEWMKSNDSLTNDDFKGNFLTKYSAAYAQYFVKFIEGYRRAGIPIYAITVQNEPIKVPASHEGMNFPVQEASDFIRSYLRPALREARLNTRIFGLDESYNTRSYLKAELREAGGLSGIAWHCYTGDPDTVVPTFQPLTQVLSECANTLIHSPASDIMIDGIDDGESAGDLWNLALEPDGGPVVRPDTGCPGCQGVLVVDPATHQVTYSHDFYGLGEVGSMIQRGARRIAATRLGRAIVGPKNENRFAAGLDDMAYRNPDGTDVLVVFNSAMQPMPFSVRWRGRSFAYRLPAGATTAFSWRGR
jgi:glucosylceramidase